jgi:hypothetical protein
MDPQPPARAAPLRAGRTPRRPTRPAAAPADWPPLPRWIGDAGTDPAFAAGAAIFALDRIVRARPVWLGAWRMRIVLQAALAAARATRRPADAAALRDARHLTRPGDDPGPAGRLHDGLRRWAARPLRLAGEAEGDILAELAHAPGRPQAGAELAALLAADRALAERLGWPSALPLHLAARLDPTLRGDADDASASPSGRAQPAMLLGGARAAHAEAATVARQSDKLTAAAAALRTRDEGRGLALILADESVAPWRMAGKDGLGSDRAARRFCETLHARGALRLLTDRPTFRLYGL